MTKWTSQNGWQKKWNQFHFIWRNDILSCDFGFTNNATKTRTAPSSRTLLLPPWKVCSLKSWQIGRKLGSRLPKRSTVNSDHGVGDTNMMRNLRQMICTRHDHLHCRKKYKKVSCFSYQLWRKLPNAPEHNMAIVLNESCHNTYSLNNIHEAQWADAVMNALKRQTCHRIRRFGKRRSQF